MSIWQKICALLLTMWTFGPQAQAGKGNQPIYQDPFDLGAGGSSLTRASRDGRIFANPALFTYGPSFHRWFGTATSLISNKESLQMTKDLAQGRDINNGEESGGQNPIVEKAFSAPIHVGYANSLGWITSNFGLSAISRFEADFRAKEIGQYGSPDIRLRVENYQAAAMAFAARIPGIHWFSLGVTGKYVMISEPDRTIEISDEQKLAEATDTKTLQQFATLNTGAGADVGALFFFQGQHWDYSLALKVDDLGDTKLQGDSVPDSLKQVASVGTAITWHGATSALHLSLDYRDIQDSYEDPKFKKFYAGTKLLLFNYIGLSTGVYHGYPTWGFEIDFVFMRFTGTYYTREFGDSPGVDPRRLYMGTVSVNWWPF